MAAPAPPPLAVAEPTFLPSLPPALASPRSPLVPLSCVPHGEAVSRACSSSSSSVPASDVASLPPLSLLHPSFLASPAPHPPTSLVALWPLAPTHALLPPTPATNITCMGEDIGDQTGRVVTRRSLAGGVRAAWEMSQEVSHSRRGRHKPHLILTLTPAVAPRALPPCVSSFTRPRGRSHGGSVTVLGATAAPLDRLSGPSAWTSYRRNYTKPPCRSFSLPFSPSRWPGCRRKL